MAKLIYSAITSLHGYVADQDGKFDWATPDEEVFAFGNDLERSVGTYLYGRRMYQTMVDWETMRTDADQAPLMRDFDPEAIRRMKASAGADITVGGAELAGRAIKAGLVDELQLFLTPILVGGGTASLPDNVRVRLELLEERRLGKTP
jgi:dihydrofolate reductase